MNTTNEVNNQASETSIPTREHRYVCRDLRQNPPVEHGLGNDGSVAMGKYGMMLAAEKPRPSIELFKFVDLDAEAARARAASGDTSGTDTPPDGVVMGKVSKAGAARARFDVATLREAVEAVGACTKGFQDAATLYEIGTSVNATGVANAKRSRLAWEESPDARESCEQIAAMVVAEDREDVTVANVRTLGLDQETGDLLVNGRPHSLTRESFAQLCGPVTQIGGPEFLASLPPAARAAAFAVRQSTLACEDIIEADETRAAWEGKGATKGRRPLALTQDHAACKVRTRRVGQGREAYAVVTPAYKAWDIDAMARELARTLPDGLRGAASYDGTSFRIEATVHSDVSPEDYVCGEVFKMGIIASTNDAGKGGLSIGITATRNRCRNLIVLDESMVKLASLRHVGTPSKIAEAIGEAIMRANTVVEVFLARWGQAAMADVMPAACAANPDVPVSIEKAIPGFFASALRDNRALATLRGSKRTNVPLLVRAWEDETSKIDGAPDGSLGRVVNAYTRFAHTAPNLSVRERTMVESYAGSLLVSKSALPWEPVTF